MIFALNTPLSLYNYVRNLPSLMHVSLVKFNANNNQQIFLLGMFLICALVVVT